MAQTPDEVVYRVYVQTGGSSDESKDTDVAVTLVGENGSLKFKLRRKNCVHCPEGLFLKGAEDVFEVKHGELGDIDLVQVDHNSVPVLDLSWFLESITIEDTSSKKAYVFPCHSWFSESKGDGRQSRAFINHKVFDENMLQSRPSSESFHQFAAGAPVASTSKQSESKLKMLADDSLEADPAKAKKLLQSIGMLLLVFLLYRFCLFLGIRHSTYNFSNWGGNIHDVPVYFFIPYTLSGVKTIIKCANWANMSVRTCGARHTWTELYSDAGEILIDPQWFGSLSETRIKYDPNTPCQVTILCNVTAAESKRHQLKHNYNFLFNTVLGGVTYGGIVGTGCHGVGKRQPAHPDIVEEIQIVNSKGEVVTYDKTNESNESMLRAVTTSMGLFGFIYKTTFKVNPKQNIVVTENNVKDYTVGKTLISAADIKKLAEDPTNFSTEVFWFPYNSNPLSAVEREGPSLGLDLLKAILGIFMKKSPCCSDLPDPSLPWVAEDDKLFVKKVRWAKPDEIKDLVGPGYYSQKIVKEYLQATLFRSIPELIAKYPELTPLFTTLSYTMMGSLKVPGTDWELGEPETIVQQLPHAIHYRLWVHQGFRVYDMEFAFIVDEDYKNIAQACKDVVDLVKSYHANAQFPMSMTFEMRFMSDSQSYLCPAIVGKTAKGTDIKVAYIEILALGSLESRPQWEQFARDVAKKWMNAPGAVKPLPHWGKASEMDVDDPSFVKYLWKNNGANMQKFLDQLSKSGADPKRTFFNSYLKKIFTKPT
eukprot:m.4998 g.4998  ORF g.4998 m.4998 type:complete len:762 (+) comp11845_c0_seq1:153-2438(+)